MTVEEVVSQYPGLVFRESGITRLKEVLEFLEDIETKFPEGTPPETVERTSKEISDGFFEKLDYLNRYGGDSWQVELSSDWATLSFSLFWYKKVYGERTYQFNGGLQCNAVRQVVPSILVGEPAWWSIHT